MESDSDTPITDTTVKEEGEELIADIDVIDTILDVSWREYERIFEDKRELDQKSCIILTPLA